MTFTSAPKPGFGVASKEKVPSHSPVPVTVTVEQQFNTGGGDGGRGGSGGEGGGFIQVSPASMHQSSLPPEQQSFVDRFSM